MSHHSLVPYLRSSPVGGRVRGGYCAKATE